MDRKINYALVTGASQGYGRALAFELAKRNYNLIIASLPGENLELQAIELRKFNIIVHTYELDLTVLEQLLKFIEWVNSNFEITILINNAGIGGTSHFLHVKTEFLIKLINLNITSVTVLTHALLPNLLKQTQHCRILNVSSMAAFSPMAFKTIYPASKRFVHDFSIGLNEEFKDKNMTVSVVHPGAMKTNENVSKRISNHGFASKLGVLTPEQAAQITIKKFLDGKKIIILGFSDKFQLFLLKIIPSRISLRILSEFFRKQTTYN